MMDGPRLKEELMDEFGGLPDIEEVTFSPECSTQAKPAVLVLNPHDDVGEERLEEIGMRAREVMRRVIDDRLTDVKASLEHPVTAETDEDGEVVDLVDVEDEWVIKLRWREITHGGLSPTRLGGREIREGLPEGTKEA